MKMVEGLLMPYCEHPLKIEGSANPCKVLSVFTKKHPVDCKLVDLESVSKLRLGMNLNDV
jgi:hypothetical protein